MSDISEERVGQLCQLLQTELPTTRTNRLEAVAALQSLSARVKAVEAENERLRKLATGTLAAWELIPHEQRRGHRGSWPRDRFESWLEDLADAAGFNTLGIADDEERLRAALADTGESADA